MNSNVNIENLLTPPEPLRLFRLTDPDEKAKALHVTHLWDEIKDTPKENPLILVNSNKSAPFLIIYLRDGSGRKENEFVLIVYAGTHLQRVEYAKHFVKQIKEMLNRDGMTYYEVDSDGKISWSGIEDAARVAPTELN